MRKEFDIAKFYYKFILLSITISFIIMYTNMLYYGDLKGKSIKVVKEIIICMYILHIFIYSLFYYLSNKVTNLKTKKICYNQNIMNKIIFILVLINFYISYKFGVGKSVGSMGFKYGFLLNLFPIDLFFMFNYCLGNRKSVIYKLGFLIYILYKFYLGWTSFLVYIFLLEMYRFILKNDKLKKYIYISVLFLPFIYKILYTLKFYIRTKSIIKLNYIDSIVNLVSRLNNLNMTIYIYENLKSVKEIVFFIGNKNYLWQSVYYLIPKSLFGIDYDSTKNLNKQLVVQIIDKTDNYTTVEPSYIGTLIAYSDTLLIYIIYTIFLIILIGILSNFFKNKYLKMYIIIYILNYIRSGSISELVYMVYSLILMLFLNIVILNLKREKNENYIY